MSGLGADTRYYYSVGSTTETLAGDDVEHFFRTSPTPGPARAMRIWVTGDGGFANANGMAVRDAYATYNAGNPTDFWLLLGDNAYILATDADYQAALFDMHHDMLRNVPTWPTFGNHESFSSNSLTQTGPYFDMFSLPTAGQAGGVPSGTEAYYSFDYANTHFIVLDSNSAATTAGSPMIVWLEADLQSTSADWVIAFWHHPPYSKGLLHDSDLEANEIRMRTRVLPILEDYGVDLVLCGHSHSYERSFFLDGHYGLSPSFVPSFMVDSGDGNPSGDGAYRKDTIGPAPHEGAVYVVAGSSSEVRNTTLNHPAMRVGLLELGSLVLDIDDQTLTGTFLNGAAQTRDVFRIVKGSACPRRAQGPAASRAPRARSRSGTTPAAAATPSPGPGATARSTAPRWARPRCRPISRSASTTRAASCSAASIAPGTPQLEAQQLRRAGVLRHDGGPSRRTADAHPPGQRRQGDVPDRRQGRGARRARARGDRSGARAAGQSRQRRLLAVGVSDRHAQHAQSVPRCDPLSGRGARRRRLIEPLAPRPRRLRGTCAARGARPCRGAPRPDRRRGAARAPCP